MNLLIRILDLLKRRGSMEVVCVYCKSQIGEKYSNEIYRLNNKIYCSTICYYDNVKEWKDEALESYGKSLKKSRKNIVTKKKGRKKK